MTSLFNVFTHDILLNEENGITIVIGENGLGKTVILESINALFNENYMFFKSLDFQKFEFFFNNGEIWQLTKKQEEYCVSLVIGRDSVSKPVQRIREHKIYEYPNTLLNYKQNKNRSSHATTEFKRAQVLMERERMKRQMELERLRRIQMEFDISKNMSNLARERMHLDYEYRKMLEISLLNNESISDSYSEVNKPIWFSDGCEKIRVKLIETQRIITAKEIGSDSYVNSLERCSEELKDMISNAAKAASLVTSELDSTYPNRLVKKLKQGSRDSLEELNEALAKLDARRRLFSSSGLTVKNSDADLLQIDEKQKDLVNVLKLYIDDSHKKLEPFEELSKKIMLFKNIINRRFKHKRLEIKQEKGLVFRSTVVKNNEGFFETISSSKLSSGEQNELILFFKLIFNSNKNDMILIDEPELSLHISWQNKFIQDLKEVTSINDVTIVIATHSPDIIDENWDLRVKLQGVE
ncbi:AAA family ATPase [Aeromonas salmonicida]|uniref:AAA family ATPase n=1 Tax=Aeromonas salmonicida TaxID=645 RepID=UPI00224037F5|nr:AAA family ATPase [Aeromonas salmonicida]